MATTQNGIYYQDDYTKNADILADMKEMAESVDEVIQDEKENQETVEQAIQKLQTEQTAQNKKIEQLDDNQIHITTEKSSNINVKDSSDLNAKIDVFGISEQKTRSGINLTNYEDWTEIGGNEQITEKDDDKVVCTITSSSYGVCDIERTLKPNTNYTACADFEFNGTFGNQYGLRVNVNGSIASLKTDGLVNFTTDETGKARMQCYVGFPYTGANATLTVSNIRLYEGTYTRENIPDYEQYGASPSPEFPSEIENVTGNIDITVCNKNLFNIETAMQNYILNDAGIEIASQGAFVSDYILVKKDVNYFSNTRGYTNAGFYDLDKNFIKRDTVAQNATTTFDEDYYIKLNGKMENISAFQFERNDTETEFEVHEEEVIIFPLSQNQKMFEGSYLANDGIHHKRKQIELDGTEAWQVINENVFYLTFNDIKISSSALMTHFKYTSKILTNLLDNEFTTRAGTGNSVWIKKEGMTLEEFKTYLAQQKQAGTPVIVEYELETEEIEAYTEEQQEAYNQLQNAKTYKTVTNVFTENAELEMEYIADTKTYIDNKVNNMQNQLNTINELLSTTTTSAMLLDNMQTDLESEVL